MKPSIFVRLIYLWILRHFHLSCPAVHTDHWSCCCWAGLSWGQQSAVRQPATMIAGTSSHCKGELVLFNFDINIQIDIRNVGRKCLVALPPC